MDEPIVLEPIVLRLTLERMQWSILQALYPHEVELKQRIEAIVQKALASFDFEAEIERQVITTLRREMERRVAWKVREEFAALKEKPDGLDAMIDRLIKKRLREE